MHNGKFWQWLQVSSMNAKFLALQWCHRKTVYEQCSYCSSIQCAAVLATSKSTEVSTSINDSALVKPLAWREERWSQKRKWRSSIVERSRRSTFAPCHQAIVLEDGQLAYESKAASVRKPTCTSTTLFCGSNAWAQSFQILRHTLLDLFMFAN